MSEKQMNVAPVYTEAGRHLKKRLELQHKIVQRKREAEGVPVTAPEVIKEAAVTAIADIEAKMRGPAKPTQCVVGV
jgi:methionyl-tRNA formyltransferase